MVIIIGLIASALLIFLARKAPRSERAIRAFLAFILLSSYPFALFAWRPFPHTLSNILPFHLCDLAAIIAGFALITQQRILLLITYFWGIGATAQALITPALQLGPPHLPFYQFFFQHIAIVLTALYIPLALGWRPHVAWWKAPLIVFAISLVYQASTLLINLILGTNFAFSLRPPENPSLIDHLGPWPIYLFVLQAAALLIFFLLAIPFRFSKSNLPS